MWWAYRRAIKAMLVTTLCNTAAFLTTLICVVPNLMSFAIFTALLAVMNFLLVCTMWPCALILHERQQKWLKRLCKGRVCAISSKSICCLCERASLRKERVGLANADGAKAASSDFDPDFEDSMRGDTLGDKVYAVSEASLMRSRDLSPNSKAPPSPPASPPPSTPEHHSSNGASNGHAMSSTRKPLHNGGKSPVGSIWRLRTVWRRSGEVRRSMPRGSRLIERFYAECYAPFLTRGYNALWLLIVSSLFGLLFGYHALYLSPAAQDVSVWPEWHNEFKYMHARDTLFDLSEEQVHVIWGVKGVDRTGVNLWDESDLGRVVWDDEFDASDPEAQMALLRACDELPKRKELKVAEGSVQCVMGAFRDWEVERSKLPLAGNVTWPMAPSEFRTRFGAFILANQEWGLRLSVVRDENCTFRLRHLVASFTIAVERHAPAAELKPIYDAWERVLAEFNDDAPPSAAFALQSSAIWVLMAIAQLLMMYALTMILTLAAVGAVVLLVATRSPRLVFCCTLTILNIVATFTGLMVWWFEMELGMIECVVLMVSVGLMLDPLTHVAHAFNEASGSKAQRTSAALTSLGISVVSAALSTAGSCICLFFCTINFFEHFGQLLVLLLLVTVIYTNVFLAPLLCLAGPSDEQTKCLPRRKARAERTSEPAIELNIH